MFFLPPLSADVRSSYARKAFNMPHFFPNFYLFHIAFSHSLAHISMLHKKQKNTQSLGCSCCFHTTIIIIIIIMIWEFFFSLQKLSIIAVFIVFVVVDFKKQSVSNLLLAQNENCSLFAVLSHSRIHTIYYRSSSIVDELSLLVFIHSRQKQ